MSTETLQKPTAPAIPRTVKSWLTSDYFRQQVALTLPKHLTADRFTRVALTALTRIPKLAQCSWASVMKALMTCSELGLEPDGRRFHLIPYWNSQLNCYECQGIADYKGLAALAYRSGSVASIHADVVCENDEFEYDRGELKKHKVDFMKPRGTPYAAYSLIRFKDGGEKCEVMGKEEIYLVRDKSSGWQAFKKGKVKTSVWADRQSEPEMWKKTTFRRAAKWLDLEPEIQDAIERADGALIPDPLVDQEPDGRGSYVQGGAQDPGGEDDIPFDAPARQVADEPATTVPAAEPVHKLAAGEQPMHTVQDSLQELVIGGGFSFDDLLKWGQATGNIADGDSLGGFADVPTDVCKRLIRAKGGLLKGLAETKGVAV